VAKWGHCGFGHMHWHGGLIGLWIADSPYRLPIKVCHPYVGQWEADRYMSAIGSAVLTRMCMKYGTCRQLTSRYVDWASIGHTYAKVHEIWYPSATEQPDMYTSVIGWPSALVHCKNRTSSNNPLVCTRRWWWNQDGKSVSRVYQI